VGGIPVTSVIVRSSVNINAGGRTKLATIVHGTLLLVCVTFLPHWLNRIPLSCLAGILLVTGIKLASPAMFRQMWVQGRAQFLPFIATVVAIVLTDLLVGVLIGMAISVGFILHSNLRRPLRVSRERHLQMDVLRIELANQVSFLNRATLKLRLDEVPRGEHVLLDARQTDYLDPDILGLIHDYVTETAPARGIHLHLLGFEGRFPLPDHVPDFDTSNPDLQRQLTPQQVLQILKEGNDRFRFGHRLNRDFGNEVRNTAQGQFPLAVILSCIDSRTPAELIFDLGVGDVFCVRIAGNVAREKVLASLEYACAVAGTKLIVVLGHTRCGAVTTAVDLYHSRCNASEATGCEHLNVIVEEIQKSIDESLSAADFRDQGAYVDEVARRNVLRTMEVLTQRSSTLQRLVRDGRIAVVGAMYDVVSGRVDFLNEAQTADEETTLQLVG
jgi:carbonic anhydrase